MTTTSAQPLSGRVALVTGGGRGNGRALALGLARAGASVIVVDLDGDAASRTAADIKAAGSAAWAHVADVSDSAACLELSRHVAGDGQRVSVLVNNAGVLATGKVGDPDAVAVWRRVLSVNADGAFNMVHAFLGDLKATRGSIINVGSIQSFVSTPDSAAYSSSKGAILQLTRALASELARFGIRVNGIAPGVIATAMTADILGDPARSKALLSRIPMRRTGEAEELVGPVVFLASDAASYVTGAMLPVDGGYLIA